MLLERLTSLAGFTALGLAVSGVRVEFAKEETEEEEEEDLVALELGDEESR